MKKLQAVTCLCPFKISLISITTESPCSTMTAKTQAMDPGTWSLIHGVAIAIDGAVNKVTPFLNAGTEQSRAIASRMYGNSL